MVLKTISPGCGVWASLMLFLRFINLSLIISQLISQEYCQLCKILKCNIWKYKLKDVWVHCHLDTLMCF